MSSFEERAGLWDAAALCLIAGFVDAIGYFDLGHVFTANMTGNTVLLGVALVKADGIALTYAATIAAFCFGVVAATVLKIVRLPLPAVFLMAGTVLVGLTLVKTDTFVTLCVLAFTMGLQGGAISTFSGVRLPTVVVTSTLVNLIDGLVRRHFARLNIPLGSSPHVPHLAAAWFAYGAGGAAGYLAEQYLGAPLLAPAALYVIVAVGLFQRGA
jgi:uncharacterized membrane protein YoaK (UPF0700 family)